MVHDSQPIRNALLSVSDKAGLEDLARALAANGVQLFSTGGTLKFLNETCGLPAESVESVTEFPEMMDGRLKTLHPKVFGGILARRDNADDEKNLTKFGMPYFDLVVVNLYPFANYRGQALSKQIENIDIGGPSLLRAAAKNHTFVNVLSDPSEYPAFIAHLEENSGKTLLAFRKGLALRTFARTAAYDAMIAEEWAPDSAFPSAVGLTPAQSLRYGENPHQKAAFVGTPDWKILQGKELSYNNLLDAEAATRLTEDFAQNACTIVKHNNPCGVAAGLGLSSLQLFKKAQEGDSVSAFGGIVAFNTAVDSECAQALSEIFLEVIIARSFSADALKILSKKSNLRLIEWARPRFHGFEVRAALGGWLVQDADRATLSGDFKVVSQKQPSAEELADLQFAWIVCKHVKSNAIVVAKKGQTAGIGAGQMSRIDSVKIAIEKSGPGRLKDAVLASDAFFPFRDNIDAIAPTGIKAIVAPGGSRNDQQVIDAANDQNLVLVFAPERHFRH